MRVGVFFFGGVEMDDVGPGSPDPTDRRFEQKDFWHAQERLLDIGVLTEQLGYDSFWLTEHHFQHEGYEVVPNGILFGAFLAARTTRLRIGSMFNVVGQWHPLRLAEDFAVLHNLSGGRAILGVGRGTVPREMQPLSGGRMSVGSFDNPDQVDADALNREVTEEALDVIITALENDVIRHVGKHFVLPPPGIPDRGGEVTHLSMVPRPRYPYEVWQPVTSPPTLTAVPTRGFGAVYWLQHDDLLARNWERYAEVHAAAHGYAPERGEKRMLVLNVWVGDTVEQARQDARTGHDEFWRFLGPYGWSRGYRLDDGSPAPPGLIPTFEQSLEQRTWVVGDAATVAEGIAHLRDRIGVEELVLFPNFPGDTYDASEEQLTRLAEDVLPLL
jgi:alkanesulfonate monooxygenase SsuD/methylene tetrahydromethanopterin reductase-like flavin-dependent oxidoreductase (luciferase family)